MPIAGLWGYVFAFSKLIELGDTAFIVLRKTPLSFLHWYHHTSVFIFSWYLVAAPPAFLPWFGSMNYCIHSIMYTYYALRANGRKVPSKVALVITILQLTQMIMGVSVTVSSYVSKLRGNKCLITDNVFYFSMAMYGSYALLFLNFLCRRYCLKSNS